MTKIQLEKIGQLSAQLSEKIKAYKESLDNDEIFEVRKEILTQLHLIEKELAGLQELKQTENS